jgi:hypothetical protein
MASTLSVRGNCPPVKSRAQNVLVAEEVQGIATGCGFLHADLPRGIGGVMVRGARFFFLALVPAVHLARWDVRQSRLQSVTKGRCFPHPPLRPFIRPPGFLCGTTTCEL